MVMAEHNLAPTWVATAGFGFLTFNSGLAIYRARGDAASVVFVLGSYLALLLLFHCLRAYERVPNWVATVGFGFLTFNSGFAIYRARDDAASVLFVLGSYLALLLLFTYLRAYERAPTWVGTAGFGFPTLNSGLAIYRANGDPASIFFVAGSYLTLFLLFGYLRAYDERAPIWATTAGLGLLTLNSDLAIYHANGDPASIVFVAGSYITLLLLFGYLRAYDERAPIWATTAGLVFLTLNSGLAIYHANGDPASIVFVAGSYITVLLLFGYLHTYERAAPGSPARERARSTVWPLSTLLTAAFSSPPDRAGHPMERQVAALMMVVLGAMACDSALAVHDARGGADVVSAAAVLVLYAALLALTLRFVRAFAGLARGIGNGQDQGRGVAADAAAHGDVRLEG